MTILSAFDCGDYLVLASDSEAYDQATAIKATVTKIWAVPGMTMVWAATGSYAVSEPYRSWVESCDKAEFTTWESFVGPAVVRLSHLCGQRREFGNLARSDVADGDLASALFVGYIGGVPEILSIGSNGAGWLARRQVKMFEGNPQAQANANAIFETLKRERGAAFSVDADLAVRIMEDVTSVTMGTAPPIQMYKVDATSVVKVL